MMSLFIVLATFVFVSAFLFPTEKGSLLSIILSNTCLPLRGVPLLVCILFPLGVGYFYNKDLALYLAAALVVQLILSIKIGREVASRA